MTNVRLKSFAIALAFGCVASLARAEDTIKIGVIARTAARMRSSAKKFAMVSTSISRRSVATLAGASSR